jgi:hypothetical protein
MRNAERQMKERITLDNVIEHKGEDCQKIQAAMSNVLPRSAHYLENTLGG